MVRTVGALPRRLSSTQAGDEFLLTTVLLFLAVSVVLVLRDPGSGRRSGGHMNPAVTLTLWLMEVFPGRSVVPYVVAQLAGSVAGTALARLVWGQSVTLPTVGFGVIRHSPTWRPALVFIGEAGAMMILTRSTRPGVSGRRSCPD